MTFTILPLITHYYLSNMGNDCGDHGSAESHISRNTFEYDGDEEKR
jgi:hypothetical protein